MFLALLKFKVRVMVINTTFNNISVILWWQVLLVEETVPGENHQPAASHDLGCMHMGITHKDDK